MLRLLRLLAALGTLVVLGAACGGSDSDAPARIHEIVVPLGTQAALGRGEDVSIMPARLEFHVGETLTIRNEDVVATTVGPYLVQAGEELEVHFGAPGRYEGSCPISEGDTYEIVVTG